ncbi:acyl-CoA-binding domain-containing protein 4 isoform X2 [Bombina bombina]|uniref:acyl-CoA-binding domain-containing protein 4 isoform X2 n=1 Tax=Bombina bombina TaxID=8345 RepID=UPI00235A6D9A|nr:acyl-CoA-binding domain-containing protein 4 isoform X2 [Bombina bombina]
MGTDQDETGPQRQFNAAVSVIQGLPKRGSYRPSHDEMLRFYGYYKQAVLGPCNIPRPGFWDLIGKYKWDAWNRLGGMSREEAMRAYVKEMKMVAQKILDTVPLDNTSPEMFEPFRPLYEVIPDMPRPPGSFFQILPESESPRETDEQEVYRDLQDILTESQESWESGIQDAEQTQPEQRATERQRDPIGQACLPNQERGQKSQRWESETEDFRDSLEQLDLEKECIDTDSWIHPHLFQPSPEAEIVLQCKSQGGDVQRRDGDKDTVQKSQEHTTGTSSTNISSGSHRTFRRPSNELSPQILATVQTLQASMQSLYHRIESLEKVLQEQKLTIHPKRSCKNTLWGFLPIPSRTLLLILVWPFFVHWLQYRFYRRKR